MTVDPKSTGTIKIIYVTDKGNYEYEVENFKGTFVPFLCDIANSFSKSTPKKEDKNDDRKSNK